MSKIPIPPFCRLILLPGQRGTLTDSRRSYVLRNGTQGSWPQQLVWRQGLNLAANSGDAGCRGCSFTEELIEHERIREHRKASFYVMDYVPNSRFITSGFKMTCASVCAEAPDPPRRERWVIKCTSFAECRSCPPRNYDLLKYSKYRYGLFSLRG